jgi:hypothetical protein
MSLVFRNLASPGKSTSFFYVALRKKAKVVGDATHWVALRKKAEVVGDATHWVALRKNG